MGPKGNIVLFPHIRIPISSCITSMPSVFFLYFRAHIEISSYIFVSAREEPCLKSFHGAKMRLDPSANWAPHPNLFVAHESEVRARVQNLSFKEKVFEFRFRRDGHVFQQIALNGPIFFEFRCPDFLLARPDLIHFCNKWETEDVQKLVVNRICEEEEIAEEGGEDSDEGQSLDGTTIFGSNVGKYGFGGQGCLTAS
jgi:hypothetical protein